ncbi:MAG: hypothetical protein M8467_03325, partial [Anaerolineae bacterium]|nr:hypothetical protein [Anaerolineae bacterium]
YWPPAFGGIVTARDAVQQPGGGQIHYWMVPFIHQARDPDARAAGRIERAHSQWDQSRSL